MGISNRGLLTMLLTSDNNRTWSVIVIQPNGVTCIVDGGDSWENLDRLDYPTFGDGT